MIESNIRSLHELDLNSLRGLWKRHFETHPTARISRDLLIRAIAWQLQAEEYGGLSKAASRERKLQATALKTAGSTTVSISYKVGTKLMREWKGVVHEVVILEDGFAWSGNRYRTLSEVARAITGTRWSGPRFFGMEQSRSVAMHGKCGAR